MKNLKFLALVLACAFCAVPALTSERVQEVTASDGVPSRLHADGHIDALRPGAAPIVLDHSASDTRRILILGDHLCQLKADGRLLEHQPRDWRVHGWKMIMPAAL